jgi:hypothetical protein
MRVLSFRVLAICGGLLLSAGACRCGEDPIDPGNGDDGGADGGTTGGDAGEGCFPVGQLCTASSECCSLECGLNGLCVQGSFCKNAGNSCSASTECCSNQCTNGTCSSDLCQDVGDTCATGDECCTRNCASGQCAQIPGNTQTCKVVGQACTAGTECCSTLCRNGVCEKAYSCQANFDVCSKNAECCGNSCSVNDGGSGFCQFVSGGASGGCLQDGNPCPMGGENCCSRTCVDLGSGAPVCAPAGGCQVTGNFCTATGYCCGGTPNPNGSVTCDPTTSRCTLGISCEPPGVICGNAKLPDGGTLDVNAPVSCCTGTIPTVDTMNLCKLDSSGIPRCYGGKSTQCPTGYTGKEPCCIQAGDHCQFKDQCCNGAPCLPNPDGGAGFVCGAGSTCLPLGATCLPGADAGNQVCCLGSVCGASGEFGHVCQLPSDGGTGGGTDGGCKPNDTTCASSGECCSGTCASLDGGAAVCITPSTCQQQNDVCTSSADCCSGLACSIPSGSTSGTCQPSSCQQSGQTCSTSQPCCSGLACTDSSGNTCGATGSCTCKVIIG